MNILIIGASSVGQILCKYILREGHNVFVMDKDKEKIESLTIKYDCKGLALNASSVSDLIKADVSNMDLVIAVTDIDEVNLLTCFLAKNLGCKHVIARVKQASLLADYNQLLDKFNIDKIISPQRTSANEVCEMINYPSILHIDSFENGVVDVVELKVDEFSPLRDVKIIDFKLKFETNALICGIRRGSEVIIPNGKSVIKENDNVSIIGTRNELIDLFEKMGYETKKIKSTLIVGGGKMASFIANSLISQKKKVSIIEQNLDTCKELMNSIPKAVVLNGDGTNGEFLIDVNVKKYDSVVCVTGSDEKNLIISLFAKSQGVKKIISEISNFNYKEMLHHIQIYDTVYTENQALSEIIKYIRNLEGIKNEKNIKALYKISNNKIDAIEFVVNDESIINKALMYLKIKNNALIGLIIRNDEIITPNGKTELKLGDRVIVLSTNQIFNNIKDCFN